MCSLTIEHVLLLQNMFSYYRMCSLTTECVLLQDAYVGVEQNTKFLVAASAANERASASLAIMQVPIIIVVIYIYVCMYVCMYTCVYV